MSRTRVLRSLLRSSRAGSGDELESDLLRAAADRVDDSAVVLSFVGILTDVHVRFFLFEHKEVDEPCQFVGGGCDGIGGAKSHLDSAVECPQCGFCPFEASGRFS